MQHLPPFRPPPPPPPPPPYHHSLPHTPLTPTPSTQLFPSQGEIKLILIEQSWHLQPLSVFIPPPPFFFSLSLSLPSRFLEREGRGMGGGAQGAALEAWRRRAGVGRLCCGFSEGVISQELSDATRLLKTRNLLRERPLCRQKADRLGRLASTPPLPPRGGAGVPHPLPLLAVCSLLGWEQTF